MESSQPFIDIYLDLRFLKGFITHRPNNPLGPAYAQWLSFFRFLIDARHIRIITPNKGNIFDRHQFTLLLNQLQEPGFFADFFEGMDEIDESDFWLNPAFSFQKHIKNPHSVFLLEFEDSLIADFGKEGFVFANSQSFYFTWKKLQYSAVWEVSQYSHPNRLENWEALAPLLPPSNSLLIVDPFLASHPQSWERNLFALIDAFIPQNNDIIEITILTRPPQFDAHQEVEPRDIQLSLASYLNKYPDLEAKICIVFTDDRKIIHDRIIYTNYFELHSGRSFDYFSRTRNNRPYTRYETSIRIQSFFTTKARGHTHHNLHTLKHLIRDTASIANGRQKSVGKRNHRLLSLPKKSKA